MVPDQERIQVLARAIQGEVRGETEEILANARTKADDMRQHAQEQAAAERTRILQRAAQEAQRIRSQAIAVARSRARTLQLERREKLLDDAFEAAGQQLASIQQRPDFGEVAARLLREALIHLQANRARVRADERTRTLLTEEVVDQISRDVQVEFGPPLTTGVGVIVETTDGHRKYDNTLETRLGRMQDALRLPVYHLLLAERL
jgi:vacuolar-type H+-ATPase subunit E/Vma4